MLLVANLANTKYFKKPWHMGTHLRVLSESYQMNTNMTGFRWVFEKSLPACTMDKSSLSIGRVKNNFKLKHQLGNYLKKSTRESSKEQHSFSHFLDIAYVSKLSQK